MGRPGGPSHARHWSTTSCSACGAPSASSSRCATSGPRPTSSRPSTTRTAPRAASRTATSTPRSSSACGPTRAHLPRAAAALPGGDRVVRPVRLRPRGLELERLGARRDLRRATPCTSPTATTRSATPGTSATARSPSAPTRLARRAARPLPPLAPVGLDRRPARGPLRHQLAHHPGAHPGLLRPRLAHRLPAGGHRALPPAPVGDHYLVLSELMPHKRIDVAVEAFNRLGFRS